MEMNNTKPQKQGKNPAMKNTRLTWSKAGVNRGKPGNTSAGPSKSATYQDGDVTQSTFETRMMPGASPVRKRKAS